MINFKAIVKYKINYSIKLRISLIKIIYKNRLMRYGLYLCFF